jgi:6-phosphogluconolactonase
MTDRDSWTSAIERLVVGGYTAEMDGHAHGLSILTPTGAGDEARFVETASAPIASPSFVIAHPSRPWLFAVTENSPSSVTSLRLESDGALTELSRVATGGDLACHLALSSGGSLLLVANYGSGSVSSFLVGADGLLSECRDLVTFSGSGPNAERQGGPHAHQAVWDGEVLLVCDLGTDLVHRLTVDEQGRFTAQEPLRLPSGSGPRHCLIVQDHLLVACELNAELWVGRRTEEGWAEAERLSSTQAADPTPAMPSGIVSDGSRILVANRGPGTIAALRLSQGRVIRLGEYPAGGAGPRDLTLARGRLWVANQSDDRISVLSLDALENGPELEISAPTPTCVVVLPDGEIA